MTKDKTQILEELRSSFAELLQICSQLNDDVFNTTRNNKWTPAENIQHLITATRITSVAFSLPKIFPVVLYGRPKRASHGFSKVVDKYLKQLNDGAKATGIYVPRKVNYSRTLLTEKLRAESEKLVNAIEQKWPDEDLDKYQIAHPILGRLTHRELCYFTIYHNGHHANTVRQNYLS